jgi:O-acetyl-ADP-ribose deacetylase (regulator of RNase III)
MLSYAEVSADLFTCPAQAIAHCVSADLAMGKGIALQFRNRFGRVDILQQQEGLVLVLDNVGPYSHIFYLVTKERYWHKPTYESLYASLVELRRYILLEGITTLAIPILGCGLDRLDWSRVRIMLHGLFADVPITLTVCHQ